MKLDPFYGNYIENIYNDERLFNSHIEMIKKCRSDSLFLNDFLKLFPNKNSLRCVHKKNGEIDSKFLDCFNKFEKLVEDSRKEYDALAIYICLAALLNSEDNNLFKNLLYPKKDSDTARLNSPKHDILIILNLYRIIPVYLECDKVNNRDLSITLFTNDKGLKGVLDLIEHDIEPSSGRFYINTDPFFNSFKREYKDFKELISRVDNLRKKIPNLIK